MLRRLGAAADVVVPVPPYHRLAARQGVIGLDEQLYQIRWLQDRLRRDQPARVFQLAGDCGAQAAPISWLNSQRGSDLNVVWIDAHGDLNTPQTSPSRTFHGMVLRTLLGDGPEELVRLVERPLRPEQVHLVGVRALDPEESDYIKLHSLQIRRPSDLNVTGRVYVHLDLDSLDPQQFGHVPFPEPNGLTVSDVFHLLCRLREHSEIELVGIGLTESTALLDEELSAIDPILGEFMSALQADPKRRPATGGPLR